LANAIFSKKNGHQIGDRQVPAWQELAEDTSSRSSTSQELRGAIRMAFLQVSVEPSLRHVHFTHHRLRRDANHFGSFLDRQSAEVAQFDNSRLTRIKLLQP